MATKSDVSYLLEDIDREKVQELLKQNEDSTVYFNDIVDETVNRYCKYIEDLMRDIEVAVSNPKKPITDDELDYYILKLPNSLYFVGECVEALGVKKDIAKAQRVNVYSNTQLDSSGTVADKDAKASKASQYEQIIENMYDRASRKVKQRLDAGYEMLSAMKKVLSRRLLAYQLSGVSSGRLSNSFVKDNNLGD